MNAIIVYYYYFFYYYYYYVYYINVSAWNCSRGFTKCQNDIQCVRDEEICNGYATCVDKSDEDVDMCKGE